jgi:colanic acid biosynthesis glycosyl transferase WcaI
VKILYVSQYFPPEMGAPAARVAELSRLWAEAGHEVTVLTGFPNHPTGLIPPEYRHQLRHFVMREKFHNVNVVRTWLFPCANRRAHQRMLNYSSFALSSAITGLFLSHSDIVIGTSPQLLVALSGWWLARIRQLPFIFEVRDLWPESLAAVGVGNRNSLLYRALARVAGFLHREASHIVVVTPAFKRHLVDHQGVCKEKISVVENGVETDVFSPNQPSTRLRKEIGANGNFVVSYIGTIGMAHGLECLLDAAAMLQNFSSRFLVMLIGEGAEKERLISLAQSRGLANVRFVDQQARDRVPEFICASNACLVLLKKADLFKTVLPTKLLEFMSCGRPIITNVDGQTHEIVMRANAGVFVNPENPVELANAILLLASQPELCESLGRNGRRFVVQHFTRQQSAVKYLSLLTTLLGQDQRAAATAA